MDSQEKKNWLELPALKVNQPLGEFFVVSISAQDLLDISFSEPLKYIDNSGNVQGSQRPKNEKRLKEIATYIESVEMAFPNSIILGANYTRNGSVSKDPKERWVVEYDEHCNTYKLIIPQKIPLAAVIDGQHRLNAFSYVTNRERFSDLQLLCSIYFDLPNSYQAFLFATINSNQKKVDRSLALEQFGYNVDDESEKAWTPEKFAVFLSRKLNIDKENSPFYQHIKVAPLNGDMLFPEGITAQWVVSTATIVDGIDSLLTSNAKRDRIIMQQASIFSGRNRNMIRNIKDVSPLRDYFIDGRDQTIYNVVTKYFNAFASVFWGTFHERSYIFKTVGVQAGFDILKMILNANRTVSPEDIDFKSYLSPASHIDFSDKFFQASGIGRGRIKNTIALADGLVAETKLKQNDLPFYSLLVEGGNSNLDKERMQWDEDAENAVITVLEKANWNYDSDTVSIDTDEDYQKFETFKDYDKFFNFLVMTAETAYVSALPSDQEFADQQRENFDPDDLVNSYLIEYEPNLKKLGWVK